jgi:tight adherence protein C
MTYIYIIVGTVFVSVFILILSFGLPVVLKKGSKSNISKVIYYGKDAGKKDDVIPSFNDRIMRPFFSKVAAIIKKFSAKEITEETNHKLEMAGIMETVGTDGYLAIKLLIPFGFLVLIILEFLFVNVSLVYKLFSLIVIPISYFLPDLFVRARILRRQEDIRVSLPNALDLLTISIEAGMGFNTALARVSENIKGPLGEEFNKMLHEIQIGFTRREAFRNLDKRTDIPDLSTFIVSMIQADVFGISIGKVLRVQASEMRTRRRLRAEENGFKAPVKLVFPVIFCLFPALLTIVLGPGAIQIYNQLFKAF